MGAGGGIGYGTGRQLGARLSTLLFRPLGLRVSEAVLSKGRISAVPGLQTGGPKADPRDAEGSTCEMCHRAETAR